MTSQSNPAEEHEIEGMLTETFGPAPSPDIEAWRRRYPSALAWLNPQRIRDIARKRRRMRRVLQLAATAAAICAGRHRRHILDHHRPKRRGIRSDGGANPKRDGDHVESNRVHARHKPGWKDNVAHHGHVV